MKVPPGTAEYENSVRAAKKLLNRLKKGSSMLEEAVEKGETVNAKKIIELWEVISKELFTHLEIATLIHQQYITGNSVVVKSDGSLRKVEQIMDMNPSDVEGWTLLTIEKLQEIFGQDYMNFLEIKEKQPPLN